jgi:nitroimidazol reductase NimA-like FMN-containing flavoprotein (pyridoxamine 5'-phosphate oxidase superfamily)
MIGDRMTERTEPADLNRDACLLLLGAGGLGRVVFTASAMPAVQPVSYVRHGDEVVFRVADGSPLSIATRHAVVGFQVDDIDPVTHAGWSVLGVGQAYELSDADRRSVPVAGSATHTVAVPLLQLTGQRVLLGYTDVGAAERPAVPPRTVSCC